VTAQFPIALQPARAVHSGLSQPAPVIHATPSVKSSRNVWSEYNSSHMNEAAFTDSPFMGPWLTNTKTSP
jgi:hypothetical protein